MNQSNKIIQRPVGVNIIIVVTILDWIATVGLWILLYATRQIPTLFSMGTYWKRSYVGLVYGFAVADLTWVQLFSLVIVVGLWRMRPWGWTAAMMLNAIWIYTTTYTLVRNLTVEVTSVMVFFSFFTIYAIVSTVYLWKRRVLFWRE